MRGEVIDEFSALLLELYRASAEDPLEEHQDKALQLLKRLVPFDSSMWGAAVYVPEQGIDIHSIHLHEQAPQLLVEYNDVKHLDTTAATIIGQPLITRGFHCPTWFHEPQSNAYRDFQNRFEIQNVYITALTNESTGLAQWVSLFRRDEDQHCQQSEVQWLNRFVPHMMQALSQNRSRQLDRWQIQSTGSDTRNLLPAHEVAIIDARGVIYHATPGFEFMLRSEWSTDNHSGRLPSEFLKLAQSNDGGSTFVARGLAFKHHTQKDLMFLRMRRSCLADLLPPRQREVAQSIARGLSYKEVAQQMGVAPATVRSQLQKIYERLEVQNVVAMADALRLAQW